MRMLLVLEGFDSRWVLTEGKEKFSLPSASHSANRFRCIHCYLARALERDP